LWKELEALGAAPHAVQDNGQFAGHRDDGSLLGSLSSAGGQLQALSAQGRIGTEAAQNVLRRLYQQVAQISIAGSGDALLRIGVARLALAWTQAEEGSCGATAGNCIGPVEGEHVGRGHQWADTRCAAQSADLGVFDSQLFDLFVDGVDLKRLRKNSICGQNGYKLKKISPEAHGSFFGHPDAIRSRPFCKIEFFRSL